MHKLYLTEPEVSFICGADAIVAELGGFPSMENGKLIDVSIAPSHPYGYNVFLVFDIENWAAVSSRYRYANIPRPKHRYIRMCFFGVQRVYIDSPHLDGCGEIKFGNTTDRKKMYQDDSPLRPIIVERPFYSFYIRDGSDFVLEFNDSKCWVEASFLNEEAVRDCLWTRPDTTKRNKLLRALLDQGLSVEEIGKIILPMRGKTQDEKEQIADRIMKERGIE